MLVMLAGTAGSPTAMSTGKVMRVPPPARAFTAPPAMAARPMRRYEIASKIIWSCFEKMVSRKGAKAQSKVAKIKVRRAHPAWRARRPPHHAYS